MDLRYTEGASGEDRIVVALARVFVKTWKKNLPSTLTFHSGDVLRSGSPSNPVIARTLLRQSPITMGTRLYHFSCVRLLGYQRNLPSRLRVWEAQSICLGDGLQQWPVSDRLIHVNQPASNTPPPSSPDPRPLGTFGSRLHHAWSSDRQPHSSCREMIN
jgi:hypothetical protein